MSIKCTEVIITPTTPLTCKVSGGTNSIITHKVKNKIVSLELADNKIISLGDKIKVKNLPYKVNIIEKNITNGILYYNLKIAERNKSSLFILPMLGGNRRLFLYDKSLLNCFIGFGSRQDCIVLFYRWSSDPLFARFEKALQKFRSFVLVHNPDPYHIIFVFKVPQEYKEDFQKFKQGKYSRMGDLYKLKILDFHNMDIEGVLAQILFRSEIRRKSLQEKLDVEISTESELLSIINEDDEILNLEKYGQ